MDKAWVSNQIMESLERQLKEVRDAPGGSTIEPIYRFERRAIVLLPMIIAGQLVKALETIEAQHGAHIDELRQRIEALENKT